MVECKVTLTIEISIHAPREGCDGQLRHILPDAPDISIHAPREGCDIWMLYLVEFAD